MFQGHHGELGGGCPGWVVLWWRVWDSGVPCPWEGATGCREAGRTPWSEEPAPRGGGPSVAGPVSRPGAGWGTARRGDHQAPSSQAHTVATPSRQAFLQETRSLTSQDPFASLLEHVGSWPVGDEVAGAGQRGLRTQHLIPGWREILCRGAFPGPAAPTTNGCGHGAGSTRPWRTLRTGGKLGGLHRWPRGHSGEAQHRGEPVEAPGGLGRHRVMPGAGGRSRVGSSRACSAGGMLSGTQWSRTLLGTPGETGDM